jgi:hypothetical protein
MATRSNIAMKTPEGRIVSIYCHWDGYPEHNGEMLRRYYNTTAKVAELISLGSLSSLREEIGEQHDFNARYEDNDIRQNWCMAYHRDRGEELRISTYNDIPSWIADMEEYAYLWNGKEWLVNDHGECSDYGIPVFNFVDFAQRKDVMEQMGWDAQPEVA